MDWKEIDFLLREQSKIIMKFSAELTKIYSNQDNLAELLAPLTDGTLDDGDLEEMTDASMKFIKSIPVYSEWVEFSKLNREALGKMYNSMGTASSQDYDKFIELTQRIPAELAAQDLIKTYQEAGMVEDNRS